jgi:hypothetical protein
MINHARTLLANLPFNDFERIGEEIIDPRFVPKVTTSSSAVTTIRRILFGSNPDAEMINYRCRQFMGLLHASELVSYVTGLDSRITYDLTDAQLFQNSLFQPTVATVASAGATVVFAGGQPNLPDYSGKLLNRWRMRLTSISAGPIASVVVTTFGVNTDTNFSPPVDANGISSTVQLPTSTLLAYLAWPENNPLSATTGEWLITARSRPQLSFAELESAARGAGEAVIGLFGRGSSTGYTEPLSTFYSLWQTHPLIEYRFGALLLALVYQMDAL